MGLMDVGLWYLNNIDFKVFYIYVYKNYYDKYYILDEEFGLFFCKIFGDDGWVFEFWICVSFGCNFWCKRNVFVESLFLFFCKIVNLYIGYFFKIFF